MYTVASPRGGGQLPNPNECYSTPTSETRGIYPHRKILMLMSGVTAYVFFHARRLPPPPKMCIQVGCFISNRQMHVNT